MSLVGCWTWRSDRIDLSDEEFERVDAFDRLYQDELQGDPNRRIRWTGNHQLGGIARAIQHPVEEEVVQALNGLHGQVGGFDRERWLQLKPQAADWRLLLQIDSDETLDAMWGDAGTVWWMARRDDVAAGRWENGMWNFQCC
jgi:uncharacterized protein YwqG